MGVVNKLIVDKEIRDIAAKENIYYKRHFSTPAPFNNLLWYVILENDSGFNIGYHSVYDSKGKFHYNYFPRNEFLLKTVADNEDLQHLLRFSQGYYTAEKWGDTLVFNDLRFGQEIGWALPKAHFVFHYYLKQGADNKLVVQRGRFTGWNKFSIVYLFKRIRGD
jgi:inner membrane protein